MESFCIWHLKFRLLQSSMTWEYTFNQFLWDDEQCGITGNKQCIYSGVNAVKWNCGAGSSLRGEGCGSLVLLDLNTVRVGSDCCCALYNFCHVSENTEQSAFPSLEVPTFFLLWFFFFWEYLYSVRTLVLAVLLLTNMPNSDLEALF